MTETDLFKLLERVSEQSVAPDEAVRILQDGPFRRTQMQYADLDHHRTLRHGIGEVVYGEGKSADQIVSITEKLAADGRPVLITRLSEEKIAILTERFPDGRTNTAARTFIANSPAEKNSKTGEPFVAVLAAGTSDAFAAEEACEVCVAMDTAFERFYDVGVAGLHRLLDKRDEVQKASALVVVAGMEGALPSVVGGLFGKPLFAVPTSVGYGASFGGVSALLAMLNSCAAGVTVVNIDNGFSAGFAACQVVREINRKVNG